MPPTDRLTGPTQPGRPNPSDLQELHDLWVSVAAFVSIFVVCTCPFRAEVHNACVHAHLQVAAVPSACFPQQAGHDSPPLADSHPFQLASNGGTTHRIAERRPRAGGSCMDSAYEPAVNGGAG